MTLLMVGSGNKTDYLVKIVVPISCRPADSMTDTSQTARRGQARAAKL